MRIHRIYCKSVSGSDSVFDLDQSQSDHLIKVLRLKADDEVEAFDGKGLSAICRIGKKTREREGRGFNVKVQRQICYL